MLNAIALIFTEGHNATSGDSLVRVDLTTEAIRLARVLALRPNAVVAINRAVAVAEHRGPDVALAALETVDHDAVDGYQPYHAARADLLARTGTAEAITAYDRAIELTPTPPNIVSSPNSVKSSPLGENPRDRVSIRLGPFVVEVSGAPRTAHPAPTISRCVWKRPFPHGH